MNGLTEFTRTGSESISSFSSKSYEEYDISRSPVSSSEAIDESSDMLLHVESFPHLRHKITTPQTGSVFQNGRYCSVSGVFMNVLLRNYKSFLANKA